MTLAIGAACTHDWAMKAFAALIDALVYTGSRNTKLKLIGDYLRATPDPDRGWALAALTGKSSKRISSPATLMR